MKQIIDLHIHSICSDGALTPKEIIDEAIKNNVKTISITDHDTIDSYTEELFTYAKEKINLITGVEISSKIKKLSVHVLGYNIDVNNELLKNELKNARNSRHIYLRKVSKILNELGYILNLEELEKVEAVTKAHIAQDIVTNPLNRKLLLKEFNYIPKRGEFIETIMNEGCRAYVEKQSITPAIAAKLIRQAGGKVVLAHPVCYNFEDNLSKEEVENIIKELNPDGLETNYIYFDKHNNKINEIEKWNKVAEEYNLFKTVGSDFHKFQTGHNVIGLIDENIEYDADKIISNIKL